jgi:hypothetical protein
MQAIGQAGVDILLLSTPIAATYVTSYLRGSRAARNG